MEGLMSQKAGLNIVNKEKNNYLLASLKQIQFYLDPKILLFDTKVGARILLFVSLTSFSF